MRSILAAGRITRSMSSGWPTFGRSSSSNFSCTVAAPVRAPLTAPTMLGEIAPPGSTLRTFAAFGFPGAAAAPDLSPEPQPPRERITAAVSAGSAWRMRPARVLGISMMRGDFRSVLGSRSRGATIARLTARAHVPSRHSGASEVQQRRLIDGPDLLQQILQVTLPVARLPGPRKGTRKGRVVPAVRHPGGVVQHAQTAQRFDEAHFAKVEVRELPVTLEQLAPLALLLRRRPRQHHPQVLDRDPAGAVIEVHEHRPVLVPQQIPQVAVPVQPDVARAGGGRKGLADALQQ